MGHGGYVNLFVATAIAASLIGASAIASTGNGAAETGSAMAAPGGDIAAGDAAFATQCTSCHIVKSDDGELLAGNRATVGPNLYRIAGRPVAAVKGFKYGKSLHAAGETGAVWSEEEFTAYVQDPTGWLKAKLDDPKARSKMGWKVRDPQEATDIFAYLHSLAPPEEK